MSYVVGEVGEVVGAEATLKRSFTSGRPALAKQE